MIFTNPTVGWNKSISNIFLDLACFLLGNSTASEFYEGWNFNSGNYLFTTDTK